MTKKELYKALSAPFPEEAIERTKGTQTHKGYDTTGVKYQYIVNRLNEVMGIGGFRVERTFEVSEKTSRSGNTLYEVSCDLIMQLGSWNEGRFEVIAESVATGGHTSSNLADAKKGAYTNGFKKAAAFFGCGWRAYAGILDDDNQPMAETSEVQGRITEVQGRITNAQIGKLRRLADQYDMRWEELKKHATSRYGKQLSYLSKAQASQMIDELIRRYA